uniref:MATH domain-containing protein n=1 Tax=Meloidogyne incognita TaxID=6306 RepID=A0A914M880_MELIC
MISDVSMFESITCKIEWKLYDLDKHKQFMQNGQYLTSKQFGNPKCPSVKWELRVYPNTYQHNSGIFVSLVQVGLEFTRRVDPHTVKTKFNIYTLDDDGNKNFCCPSTFSVFKYRTESNKYQVFKSQTTDNLEEGKDYVLVNDSTEALNLGYFLIYFEIGKE